MLFQVLRNTFFVVLSSVILVSCSSRKDDVKVKQAGLYFGVGTQNLVSKEYTEALKNLLEANKLDPENTNILNNLGMAYFFKGEKDLAIRTLKTSLKIDENNSDARINLATIFYNDKNYTEAEKLYKKVLTDLTYDKQARTYFNLGILELQIKQNTVSAENYFKKSIGEDDNYCPAYFQLGLLQYNRRQFTSALKNFKEAGMGTCFELPAPHYYQALTLVEMKRYDEARAKLEEIDSRFKESSFAARARTKAIELRNIENRNTTETHASRKVYESPDF